MLTKHSAIYILLKGSAGLFGILTLFVFTRLLSPEEYGVYAMLISAMSLIYAIFFQWLSLSVGRFYVEESAHLRKFLSTISLGFFIAVFISAILLSLGFLFFKNFSWGKWFFVLPFLAWSYAWFDLNLRIANASLEPKLYGMLSLTKASLSLIVGVLLYGIFGLYGILAGLVLSALIIPIFFMSSVWTSLSYCYIDKFAFKKLLAYGLPLAATALLTLIVDVSDRFLIAGILGKEQAGLYAASYDLVVQIMGFMFIIFYLASFPIIVKNVGVKDYKKAESAYHQYGTLLFVTSVPLLAIFAGLSSDIAKLVFGISFRASANELIPIIALGIFVGSFKIHFFDLAFQLGDKTLSQIFPALITALINILLNISWIPAYGIIGAAYATLFAFMIGLIISAFMANRVIVLPRLTSDLLKIAVAGTSMYLLFLLLTPFSGWYVFPIKMITGLVLYVILLFALNVAEVKKIFFYFSR